MVELLGLSGFDQMRAGLEGRAEPPPMHHLTGVRPTAMASDVGVRSARRRAGWPRTTGVISGGIIAVVADGPLGCSVQSAAAGHDLHDVELSMSYLRPAFPDGRPITASSRVIHRGRTLALSDATVVDGRGREVAHATCRCFIFPSVGTPAAPAGGRAAGPPAGRPRHARPVPA